MHPELVHFVRVLPEPALLVDGAGKILFANPAAAELSGLQSAQPSDARLDALISDPPEKLAEYLRLCARSRQLVPGSFRWRGRSGHDLDVRCDGTVVSPRTDSEPALLLIRCRPRAEATDQFVLLNQKIAALTQEIIERRKAELQRDELLRRERDSRLEAERIGRLKDEFLATLSHELRTPLHAILGWSQLLQRSSFDADQIRTGLQTIERNARAQSQIIDDLLDMSRIVSGKIRLDVQSVQLPALIEAAVDAVRPAADARGVRIQVTLDPLAGPVKGDPNRLQQVVWNLLTNAVKFTPRGGRVQVILERVNSHVEIVVSDTGQGIKPEFLPHLFERFRQADASTTRQHAGLGLGLSIVRHLVELHGGTVRAKSPGEGKGATFSVMLPLLAVHAADAQEIAERRHPLAAPALPEPQMPGLHGLR
ncbi:MAG TPA: PAS domain-containing sensor histidine kinase, partial [Burkholderiaceae bacterium]|nr:PAS domain-containing sensor histidine kinase [Burkholderiaceae bacterium]